MMPEDHELIITVDKETWQILDRYGLLEHRLDCGLYQLRKPAQEGVQRALREYVDSRDRELDTIPTHEAVNAVPHKPVTP